MESRDESSHNPQNAKCEMRVQNWPLVITYGHIDEGSREELARI
jgi:hypothetical protein